MEPCAICGHKDLQPLYHGAIRMGRFGTRSAQEHTVWKCSSCQSAFLPASLGQDAAYYESEDYRKEVNESSEVSDYFRMHDGEQAANLAVTGTACFRDKVVADIGCGGGSFLDGIKGHARTAIAIEPSRVFRDSLSKRGYAVFPYAQEALREFRGKVDVVTSFSVLEHVQDPLGFLRDARELLAPGGSAIISTPNADDALLEALPEAYPAFFFRKAHLWYFNPKSLENLLERAGFDQIRIIPRQRFGLSNFLGWLRSRAPQGEKRSGFVTGAMDAAWKSELERTLRCDYLFAEARLPA